MPLIPLDGVRGTLTQSLSVSDTAVSISYPMAQTVLDKLVNNGDYTYLEVSTSLGAFEIIKVIRDGTTLVIERGRGGTVAINAPKGACIGYGVNTAVVSDLLANGADPAVCDIQVEAPLKLVKTGCLYKISLDWPSDCDEDTFMGATFKIVDGCIKITEDDRCNCDPIDGTYSNATVTIKDGRVCAIQAGQTPQYLSLSCPTCNQ